MRHSSSERGFTLIEIIVVIAAIALLAGILAPLVFKNIEDARIAKARSDIKALATAMTQFFADVGEWPARDDNGSPNTLYALYTTANGTDLVLAPGAWWPDNEDQTDPLADHMLENAQGYTDWNGSTGWNGAYLETDSLDPWGNSYLVFVLGFFEPDPDFTESWVLCAGPDGTFDTIASDSFIDPDSDDLGIRLK